jgi:hypothetical protein
MQFSWYVNVVRNVANVEVSWNCQFSELITYLQYLPLSNFKTITIWNMITVGLVCSVLVHGC